MRVRQALGLDGEAKGDGQATYLMYAASFLDKVYPGRGMSSSLRMEHIKNMGASDFYKVWKARPPAPCQSDCLPWAAEERCDNSPALGCPKSLTLKAAPGVRAQNFISRLTHLLLEGGEQGPASEPSADLNLHSARARRTSSAG